VWQAVFKFADLFASHHIPYASIYGNHDDEGSLNRQTTTDLLTGLPYSVTQRGPNTIPGVGNYYIRVLAHNGKHAALTIYFLDTHSYSPDDKKYHGYDWIKPEQIKWFKDTAQSLKKDNERYSHIHLDMAFLHIPLPEYRDVEGKKMVGSMKEPPTAPRYNSGFRDALVEMGVSVASCGHDHANDYCLLSDGKTQEVSKDKGLKVRQEDTTPPDPSTEEPPTSPNPKIHKPKNDNIWLCYGGGVGFGGYGGYGGYVRRVRFFEFDANEARIKTWKRLEYGDTDKKIDEQVIVDAGRVISQADE
jgi:3',5'-cyclic AMP phosphodiesterase CpdA